MCGRFTQMYSWTELYEALSIVKPDTPSNLEPRYNITRFQTIDAVRSIDGKNQLCRMLWEFVPHWWSKTLKEKKFSSFNARAETLSETKSFAPAWRRGQRCIIPISGFYEWPRPKLAKQPPFYIHAAQQPILALAGLWGDWKDRNTGEIQATCAIITTEPNALMRSLPHHRCPVVIDGEDLEQWLTGTVEDAQQLLRPPSDDAMQAYKVSTFVNNIANQGPECMASASSQTPEFDF